MKRQAYLAISLILLGILLRVSSLDNVPYLDEAAWAYTATDTSMQTYASTIPHPPLAILLFKAPMLIAPYSDVMLRMVPLFLGLATLAVVFLIANILYGKSAAYWSLVIMSLSFWHVLASVQVDVDGAILAFLFSCAVYCYLLFEKTTKKQFLYATGVFLGLCIFAKLPGILGSVTIGLYVIAKKRKLRSIIIEGGVLLSIVAAMFAPYVLYLKATNPEAFQFVFAHNAGYYTGGVSLLPLAYLLLWGTPLLAGLSMLATLRLAKNDMLPLLWIFVCVAFYLVMGVPGLSPFDRYLMVIIPPLAMLSGKFLSSLQPAKRHLPHIITSFLIGLAILTAFQFQSTIVRHSLEDYAKRLLSPDWMFYLPITGSSGPTMLIGIGGIIVVSALAYLFMLFSLFSKKKGLKTGLIAVSLGMALAINLFLAGELAFPLLSPDISAMTNDAISTVKSSSLSLPLYTNALGISWHARLNDPYFARGGIITVLPDARRYETESSDESIRSIAEGMLAEGGTLIHIDYPPSHTAIALWDALADCNVMKEYTYKERRMGYVITCPEQDNI
ncbi:TPA: hypothetical protein HA361_03940 [Candidatus Woesearchaeota archaeon]|nr:hypothetical protein [Candidatus Woesearchaeota archaeon]